MPAPIPPPPPQPQPGSPPPGRGPARRLLVAGAVGLALVLTAFLVLQARPPLLPIPVPPGIATLDPQVRAHLARLAQGVASAPRDPDLRADLGLAFAVNGLWAEARQSFLDAVQLKAQGPLPAMYAAIALQESGDVAGAAGELNQVALRFPDAAPVWHRLGRALVATGAAAEAEAAFGAVTRLVPDAWHGWAGLGEAQLQSGKAAEAVISLERARELEPSARSIRQLLAQAYRAAQRPAEAAAEAAAGGAATLAPMPDAWSSKALDHMKLLADQFERADALLALNRPDEAIERLREAYRFHPTNAAVVLALSRALNAADKAGAAWELLAPALARGPNEVLHLLAASETAANLGKSDDALALAARALALAPKSAEARVAEANALLAAGRDEPAADSLRAALLLAPANAELGAQLGDLLWHNLQRPADARAAYEQALKSDPLHLGLQFRLTQLDLQEGRHESAARRLSVLRSLRADPQLLRELEARLRQPGPPR